MSFIHPIDTLIKSFTLQSYNSDQIVSDYCENILARLHDLKRRNQSDVSEVELEMIRQYAREKCYEDFTKAINAATEEDRDVNSPIEESINN